MNDFPKKEFISRIEKIQIHIEKENIDAIIITSPSILDISLDLIVIFGKVLQDPGI